MPTPYDPKRCSRVHFLFPTFFGVLISALETSLPEYLRALTHFSYFPDHACSAEGREIGKWVSASRY